MAENENNHFDIPPAGNYGLGDIIKLLLTPCESEYREWVQKRIPQTHNCRVILQARGKIEWERAESDRGKEKIDRG